MSAKIDMGSFQNSGLEQRLALLGKNETETTFTKTPPKPLHLPELELKSQREKIEAGDNDDQPFIFAFKSIPRTWCKILSDLRRAVAKNVLRLAGHVRGV